MYLESVNSDHREEKSDENLENQRIKKIIGMIK
jgi:hypothetical protein